MQSQTQIRLLIRECADSIARQNAAHSDQIRILQDKMLDQIPLEQWSIALTALDALLGKNRIIHMSETTNNFENVGVANTGRMNGTITGNSQHIELGESTKQLLTAFEKFKQEIQSSASLSTEQREDALSAATELEVEATKPEEGRAMSKVRNAVAALKAVASGTEAVHKLYEQVHPFIMSHFHLLS